MEKNYNSKMSESILKINVACLNIYLRRLTLYLFIAFTVNVGAVSMDSLGAEITSQFTSNSISKELITTPFRLIKQERMAGNCKAVAEVLNFTTLFFINRRTASSGCVVAFLDTQGDVAKKYALLGKGRIMKGINLRFIKYTK
ncbi:MAG: hypothetical protein JKY08_03005 [Flavobacteriaceae bacterium]|nr:hypothetical protein [Flavobacteriaceae bacterium]